MRKMGQAATEYLVIVAVVLVIALVSIALLGFFTGSDTQITESRAYWTGSASPFRILEAATAPTASLCGSSSNGYEILVQNIGLETNTITGIGIDGAAASFCTKGSASPATDVAVYSGDKASLELAIADANYTAGRLVSVNVSIAYSNKYVSKVQNGDKKLVFKASSTAGEAAPSACGPLPPGTKCCDFGGGSTAICYVASGCNVAFNTCEWQAYDGCNGPGNPVGC